VDPGRQLRPGARHQASLNCARRLSADRCILNLLCVVCVSASGALATRRSRWPCGTSPSRP
jgi:hypothetical protein